MIYTGVGVSEEELRKLNPSTLERWNSTSWKYGMIMVAGLGMEKDWPNPDAEDRETAAKILEKALGIIDSSSPGHYHSNIRTKNPEELFKAARVACALYRQNPSQIFNDTQIREIFNENI